MGTVLLLLSLLFLTSTAEVDFDLKDVMAIAQMFGPGESSALKESFATWHQETQLLWEIQQKLPKAEQGIKKKPPKESGDEPVMVATFFAIDHVEPLDEDHETMTVHGSVTMIWKDELFTWNPEKHFQMHFISRAFGDFQTPFRPWTPNTVFRTADPADNRRAETSEGLSSILTITHTGQITLMKKFTVKAPCDFNYRDFPYDTQRCSLILQSQDNFKDIWLSPSADPSKHTARQLKSEHKAPMIGEFVLDLYNVYNAIIKGDNTQQLVAGPWKKDSAFIVNEQEYAKISSIVTIIFNRVHGRYFYSFSLPLVGSVIMAQAAVFFDSKKGFVILALSLLLHTIQMSLIAEKFPTDADGTPLLVWMHYLAVTHTVGCFIGLLALLRFYGLREGLTTNRKPVPQHFLLSETSGRALYFLFTMLFVIIISVGTLYYGAWHVWES